MLGDTPQPGETPRHEGDPWSFADPDAAWWRGETDRQTTRPRHPRRRPPAAAQDQQTPGGTGTLLPPAPKEYAGEAAEAHAAAAQDVAEALDPAAAPRAAAPSAEVTAPPTAAALTTPAETVADFVAVERDHDRPDPHRYDPLRPPAGHEPRTTARTAAADAPPTAAAAPPTAAAADTTPTAAADTMPTAAAQTAADTMPTAAAQTTADTMPTAAADAQPASATEVAVPLAAREADTPQPPTASVTPPPPDQDVMVLPEPSARNRPTVPLEPGPAAARPPVIRRPRQGGAHARPTEPLPPPTGSPGTDARLERLENSPFWHDRIEDTVEVPREQTRRVAGRPRHSRRAAGLPLSAQVSLVALGLVAAFFAWVSAEPFWLAVGHGDNGLATTTVCTGTGVTQRCAGQFAAADGSYTIARVTLLGVEGTGRQPGAVTPAKMVSPDSQQAYLGGTGALLQLRWLLGFALVVLCGYAIAGVTRARQLPTARARRAAILLSLAGPLALLAGFLAAAY
ncbi:hypothetical protein Ade02nite_92470 [Paractinoplanes deccanensis]|uniref:Meckel syndrome type 1 protein n=1 Tax=Paractinoplanes deccanensis TaxID=113561 RepID=A0ABQ3YKT6_9ACTN|nr:hypothetical protein [Actinoplanes deccanensis]GID80606.1 hypothetical protein Ade02nite_92470 [Actinoplanes deccanensis]